MPEVTGLLKLFKSQKKEEAPANPNAPIPIVEGTAPAYNPVFEGWYPSRIKFKGLYDLDGLYKFLANWLRHRRYEVHETLYKSKPPELEIRIRAERKKTGFVMEVVTLHYHSWGDYDLDVVVDGKSKKMTNARMVLTISGEIRAPYENLFGEPRWSANTIERRLLTLFRRWFLKRELESIYWDALYYEIYKFHGAIKDFMKLEAKGNAY